MKTTIERRVARMGIVLVALLLLSGSGLSATTAQSETPTAIFPLTPDPAECLVEPRSVEEMIALLESGLADHAVPEITQATEVTETIVAVPVGQPAEPETVEAIIATVRELYACYNAGDLRRAFSLGTDAFIQSFGVEEQPSDDTIAFLTGEPVSQP